MAEIHSNTVPQSRVSIRPKSVAVHAVGKLKTAVQMVAIPFLLYDATLFGLIDTRLWGTVLLWISAILTVWSMVYYLIKALPEIRAKSR